jgi:hypothetical protein
MGETIKGKIEVHKNYFKRIVKEFVDNGTLNK